MDYTLQQFKSNLLEFYTLATDSQIQDGLTWYKRAHKFARSLSHTYKVSFDYTCRVVAVISPRLEWALNEIEAAKIIKAHNDGSRGCASRALGANVKKAFRILDGDVDALRGPKVEAFYHNIRYTNSDMITIDKHAWRACVSDINETYERNVPKKYVPIAQQAYKETAEELGMRPCEFQAVVWLVVKSLRPEWKGG